MLLMTEYSINIHLLKNEKNSVCAHHNEMCCTLESSKRRNPVHANWKDEQGM
jgi:hypothetical protein